MEKTLISKHSFMVTWMKYSHKLHGKAISYNNIVDIDAAIALIKEFSEPTFVLSNTPMPVVSPAGPI
jgi:AICAR transformylase/IMP cyclohydrolase PurH